MSGREGPDLTAEAHQVLRLRGKADGPVSVISVVERADADRVAGSKITLGPRVEQNHGKLGIESCKHIRPVFIEEGEEDLTVGVGLKVISFLNQFFLHRAKPVDFTVADQVIRMTVLRIRPGKGLHALPCQAHDGQSVESEKPFSRLHDPGHVRTAGQGLIEPGFEGLHGDGIPGVSENRAHT